MFLSRKRPCDGSTSKPLPQGPSQARRRPRHTPRLQLEELEQRYLLSGTDLNSLVAGPTLQVLPAADPAAAGGYTPSQIRHAYGFDKIRFNAGTIVGNGAGQTIAIVDAFDDPAIAQDLQVFDRQFGLPAPPRFIKATPQGQPPVDGHWAGEISLDVEWAHAIAPRAKILLVEARSASLADLLGAVDYARHQPGVVVVSMSWGGPEFAQERQLDSYFTTPPHHKPITFVASSGDSGATHGPNWPATSPRVLAVGGTALFVNAAGRYRGEVGWSGSGGGKSAVEPEPAYQRAVQSTGRRTNPDVSYNADPGTGFWVYDSVPDQGQQGWQVIGGTSAGAPQWAALLAIADQGRALQHRQSLGNGQAAIYRLPASDFHDIVVGNNGYPALPGYDLVTGRGSPRASRVVHHLLRLPRRHSSPHTPASQPLTATDTGIATLTGSTTVQLVAAAAPSLPIVPAQDVAYPGRPVAMTVTAYDPYEANNTVTFKAANVARLTTGIDPDGGVMLDVDFNNGSVFDGAPAGAGLISMHHSGPAWRP